MGASMLSDPHSMDRAQGGKTGTKANERQRKGSFKGRRWGHTDGNWMRPHASSAMLKAVGWVILRLPAGPPWRYPPVISLSRGPSSVVMALVLHTTGLSAGSVPTF